MLYRKKKKKKKKKNTHTSAWKMLSPSHFIFALGILAEEIITSMAQTCYFPNGNESPRDTPCRAPTSSQESACCYKNDICLDNNLCLPQVRIHAMSMSNAVPKNMGNQKHSLTF